MTVAGERGSSTGAGEWRGGGEGRRWRCSGGHGQGESALQRRRFADLDEAQCNFLKTRLGGSEGGKKPGGLQVLAVGKGVLSLLCPDCALLLGRKAMGRRLARKEGSSRRKVGRRKREK